MAATTDVTLKTVLSINGQARDAITITRTDVRPWVLEWPIAASTTAEIWDANETPTPKTAAQGFTFLYLLSTIALEVKFVADQNGGSPRNWSVFLTAGEPYILISDDARDLSNADSLLATAANIEGIWIKESAGVTGELYLQMA